VERITSCKAQEKGYRILNNHSHPNLHGKQNKKGKKLAKKEASAGKMTRSGSSAPNNARKKKKKKEGAPARKWKRPNLNSLDLQPWPSKRPGESSAKRV